MEGTQEECGVLLINPPYVTLTSSVGVGHQVPLGLLMVGGALLQQGTHVRLLDAECQHLSVERVVEEVRRWRPRVVMTGHAGSTPAHPVCMRMLAAIKRELPQVITVYGGVYPTYHAREILHANPAVDIIVRGEGEATAAALVKALEDGEALENVQGIAFRDAADRVVITTEREPLEMEDFRIGWELLDDASPHGWDAYQCFGLGRAVTVQFSRGCPHHCTYCGQFGFWMKWRHRDPAKLAEEIAWLCREKQVRFVTLADENPTTLKPVWTKFLREVAQRELPVKFFSTMRATDIVRDADILPLYRQAGIQYILMGIETTDAATLRRVKKGSTTRVDYEACRLLRENGIYSVIGHIVGIGQERWGRFWQAAKQLAAYDGDYLNAMYVTPHAWTVFAEESAERRVVEQELGRWDYRHQVLAEPHMRPWELFLAVKLLELAFHLRPRRVWRLLSAGKFSRQQFCFGVMHTGRVFLGEIAAFVRDRATRRAGGTLAQWFGNAGVGAQRHEERLVSLRVERRSPPHASKRVSAKRMNRVFGENPVELAGMRR